MLVGNHRQQGAARPDQADRRRQLRRHVAGEGDAHRFQRRTRRAAVDPRALESRREGGPYLVVLARTRRRRQTVGAGDARAPDQRHAAARGQRAAALDRDHRGRRPDVLALVLGLAQAGLAKERAGRIVPGGAGKDAVPHPVRQHVERHALADALDAAAGVGGDAGRGRPGVQRQEEDRVLLDLAAVLLGHHGAQVRPAGVEGEAARAREARAGRVLQPGVQREGAAPPARQRPGEVDRKGACVDPAAGRAGGAGTGHRRGQARIAERHHWRGKAQFDLLDPLDRSGRREQLDRRLRPGQGTPGEQRREADQGGRDDSSVSGKAHRDQDDARA